MFVPLSFTMLVLSIFGDGFKMVVLARTTMKAAAKCDKHRELHDSVNHLKVERTLFFRVYSSNHVCVCVLCCVCVVLCCVVCVVFVLCCVVVVLVVVLCCVVLCCGCVCCVVCCVCFCVCVCAIDCVCVQMDEKKPT